MSEVARVDYTTQAGEDFSTTVEWQGEDLRDFDLLLQARDGAGALVLELGTLAGTITVNSSGVAVIALSRVQTRAIAPGHYDYDLHVQAKGDAKVTPLTYGVWRFFASVTDREPAAVV